MKCTHAPNDTQHTYTAHNRQKIAIYYYQKQVILFIFGAFVCILYRESSFARILYYYICYISGCAKNVKNIHSRASPNKRLTQ